MLVTSSHSAYTEILIQLEIVTFLLEPFFLLSFRLGINSIYRGGRGFLPFRARICYVRFMNRMNSSV